MYAIPIPVYHGFFNFLITLFQLQIFMFQIRMMIEDGGNAKIKVKVSL